MAKLVIDNVFISFCYGNSSYNAEISRLILEDGLLFNVNYCIEEDPVAKQCQLSFSPSRGTGRLIWQGHTPGVSKDLVQLIGKEIEKLPHLLNRTDIITSHDTK